MTDVMYPKGAEHLLKGDIDFDTATLKVALIDTDTYTYSAADEFYDDLSGVVGTPGTLASKTMTAGVFDAADQTFTSVSGDTIEAMVIYNDTGDTATSHLIAYIDSPAQFPVTPNGGNIVIAWDATGIFIIG